jgi:hypothetical protein
MGTTATTVTLRLPSINLLKVSVDTVVVMVCTSVSLYTVVSAKLLSVMNPQQLV